MTVYYEKDGMMVSRKIADELILVPIKQDAGDLQCMYSLNGVASRIWELLDKPVTVAEMKAVLTQEYEVEEAQVKVDIVDFLEQMMDIGAVVERDKKDIK